MKKWYGICIALAAMVGTQQATATELPDQVYITEINWAGSEASNADEWVELYNPNGESVDIGGWVLTGSATGGDALAFAGGTMIPGESTLLIANYGLGHDNTTLGIDPDVVTSTLSLPNSNLEMLLTDQNGVVVDQAAFGTGAPDFGSTEPKASAMRLQDFSGWVTANSTENLSSNNQFGNPGVFETAVSTQNTMPAICEQYVHADSEDQTNADTEDSPEDVDSVDATTNDDADDDSNASIENNITVDDETVDIVVDSDLTDPSNTTVDSETNQNESNNTLEDEPEEAVIEIDDDTSTTCTCTAPENENNPATEDATNHSSLHIQPADVLITEFISNPDSGDEWIELHNTLDALVSLEGWTVEDATGRQSMLSGEISSLGYAVLTDFTAALNNGGDTIIIRDADGVLIDAITYGDEVIPAPGRGESTGRYENSWFIYEAPSPGTANAEVTTEQYALNTPEQNQSDLFNSENQEDEQSTTEANSEGTEESHTVVAIIGADENEQSSSAINDTSEETETGTTLTGIMTAEPGLFGTQIAFMNGIQLYMYSAEWPELSVGDEVRVSGEESTPRGEPRLKLDGPEDIEVLGRPGVVSSTLSVNDALLTDEGVLVTLTADIESRDGSNLFLTEEGSVIKVVAHANTGISWSNIQTSRLEVTGIIRHIDGEIRLYPRTDTDVTPIENPAPAAASGMINDSGRANLPWSGMGLVTGATAVLGYWFLKSKKALTLNYGG